MYLSIFLSFLILLRNETERGNNLSKIFGKKFLIWFNIVVFNLFVNKEIRSLISEASLRERETDASCTFEIEMSGIIRIPSRNAHTAYIGKPLVPPLTQRTGHAALSRHSQRPRVAR